MKILRHILFLLIANLVLFFLTFILVEGVFRFKGIPYSKHVYIPDENSFARFDPELGWSYIPNKSAIHEVWNGTIKKPVYFDESGFRVPRAGLKLSHTRPSIIFIGDSFTMGHGLSYEETFVGRFDSLMGISFQTINMGVQGYGSDQALLTLKKYLTRFNAKIVVYTFIEDHLRRNGNYDRRMLNPTAKFLGTKPKFALDESGKLYLQKKPLLYENYTYSCLIDFLIMRIGALFGSFPAAPEELTRAILQEMKRYSNEHGAHFVVLNWRWSDNDYDKLFQDLDVDVIDTIVNAPPGWENMRLFGGVHPNAQASNHAAQSLLKYIHEKGFLKNELKE